MKILFTLSIGALGLIGTSFAQSKLPTQKVVKSGPEYSLKRSTLYSSARGTEMCQDTSRWTWARAIDASGQVNYLLFPMGPDSLNVSAMGTYVDVPQGTSMNVAGFTFYARSIRADFASVNVNAVLYNAGADSVATGAPLASIPFSIDTSTTGFVNPMQYDAVFTTPVSVNGSFVLMIEGAFGASDSIQLITGQLGSGIADDYPTNVVMNNFNSNNVFRAPNTPLGSYLPHFYPMVSFNQTNDFTMSVSQLTAPNETVDFDYHGPSITDHNVWSMTGFLGEVTSTWDFAGTKVKDRSTSYTFLDETIDYNITLVDTIQTWTGMCLLSESKVLQKAGPNAIQSVDNTQVTAYVANGNIVLKNATGLATVYTINGTVGAQVQINNTHQVIDTSNFLPGVYLLMVNNKVWKIIL